MIHKTSVFELLAKYHEAVEGTGNANPKIANKWARRLDGYYKQLRGTEDGKVGITHLMSDSNIHVRCWAAAHSLQWEPEIARNVLGAIRD